MIICVNHHFIVFNLFHFIAKTYLDYTAYIDFAIYCKKVGP